MIDIFKLLDADIVSYIRSYIYRVDEVYNQILMKGRVICRSSFLLLIIGERTRGMIVRIFYVSILLSLAVFELLVKKYRIELNILENNVLDK